MIAPYRTFAALLLKYFVKLQISFHELPAVFGFCIFLTIYNQIVSGVMLAFSLSPEPMYIPLSREIEDHETIYTDDFFFLHERGVDYFVIFLFLHMLRKLYINAVTVSHEVSWKSGVLLFLLAQIVIFTGLVLCCSHLSDVTLTIAINAFNSFCLFIGKVSWVAAPNGDLNVDTVIRFGYLHYILAFVLSYFGLYHGLDMHYNWKTEENFDGLYHELDWYDEAVINEVCQLFNMIMIVAMICLILYAEPEALHYELFMWGDVGMSVDVRYFGVAPHWYFRPYMGWLVACPFHYLGLLGLILFFVGFFFQPTILRPNEFKEYSGVKLLIAKIWWRSEYLTKKIVKIMPFIADQNLFYQITFALFLTCLWYSFSYLPYGRFFNRLGGNNVSLIVYVYLFFYLCCPNLRKPKIYGFTVLKIF